MRYNSGGISVDDNFARFASKSYAIDKINTVDVRVTKPHGAVPVILFGFLTVMFLLSGLGAMKAGDPTPFFGIAAVCAAVAYWSWTKMKLRDYHLYLMTSSSEAQAYSSRNADEIAELRSSIEDAMSHRELPKVRQRMAAFTDA